MSRLREESGHNLLSARCRILPSPEKRSRAVGSNFARCRERLPLVVREGSLDSEISFLAGTQGTMREVDFAHATGDLTRQNLVSTEPIAGLNDIELVQPARPTA